MGDRTGTSTRDGRAPRRMIWHNVPFKDHQGNSALMSWHNISEEPGLPPLPAYAFYFVHQDFSLENFDGKAFMAWILAFDPYASHIRFEYYHLPKASAEECVEHYGKELDRRGDIFEQIRKVERVQRGETQPSEVESADEKLPGLVRTYSNGRMSSYRGRLFMSTESEWNPKDENLMLCSVEFDPVPLDLDEDMVVRFDPMEHPVYPVWMKAREEKGGMKRNVGGWVQLTSCNGWYQEAGSAAHEASEMGWKSW